MVEKIQSIDPKQLETFAILVSNHGLSIIIVIVLLLLGMPYLIMLLKGSLKSIYKTQVEISKQLTILSETVDKISRNEWTDEELKLFAFYSISDIRWIIENYIISKIRNNNIKENFELYWKTDIKGMAQTEIDNHIRLLKTTSNNKIQIRNLLERSFVNSINEIFEVFEKQILNNKIEHDKLIYATDKHLNTFQNTFKEEVDRIF